MEEQATTTHERAPWMPRGGTREHHLSGAGRSAARLSVSLLSLTMLTGCVYFEPDPLPVGTTEVEIDVGETTQVALGEFSPGIGHDWGVTSRSDADVVAAQVVLGSEVSGVPDTRDGAKGGGTAPFAVELTGTAAGTSTVTVTYCYRTAIEEGCDQGPNQKDPIEITVTVH